MGRFGNSGTWLRVMADAWTQRAFSGKSQFPLARNLASLTIGTSQGKQCALRTRGGCGWAECRGRRDGEGVADGQ